MVVLVRFGLIPVLWMPLVVTTGTLYPFVVGKALYARALIEVVAALWLVLLLWEPRYRPPRSRVLLAFAAYVLASFLSAVAGVDFTHSLWSDYQRMGGVFDLFHWFLFALVAASVLRSAGEWHTLFNWNLGVTLLLSLLALAEALGIRQAAQGCGARVCATLGNPSYLAAVLTTNVLIAAGLLARSFVKDGEEVRAGWRAFWGLTAALGVWVLFLTGTRGALAGLVAGVGVLALALAVRGTPRVRRTLALAAGGVTVAVALLFALAAAGVPISPRSPGQTTVARLMNLSLQEGSVAIRLQLMSVGLQGFLDRPFLGWGPANFARVFDRFAPASIYRYTPVPADQAHNKPVEELANKGALGTLAYLALWGTLVWAVVGRRREPREEVLAYAVLGALAGYFVQNLFLFDTPAMVLQWALLVGWCAAQEGPSAPVAEARQERRRARRRRRRVGFDPRLARRGPERPAVPVLRWAGALTVLLLLGVSLYFLQYRPYQAARLHLQAYAGVGPLEARLALARKGFDTFPPLATYPRRLMLTQLVEQWSRLGPDERRVAASFAREEIERGLKAAPNNARLLAPSLILLQAMAASPEDLERLEPLLQRLKELAPERAYTYQILASQALRKGDYREALRLVEEFEAKAPWVREDFRDLRRAAEEGLGRQGAVPRRLPSGALRDQAWNSREVEAVVAPVPPGRTIGVEATLSGPRREVAMPKILIVDDEEVVRSLLEAVLEGDPRYRLLTARDGAEAVETAVRERPDVIVLDCYMPRMTGLEVVRLLRRVPELDGLRIVMLTGADDEEHRRKALEAGVDLFLGKPFSPLQLLRQVEEWTAPRPS